MAGLSFSEKIQPGMKGTQKEKDVISAGRLKTSPGDISCRPRTRPRQINNGCTRDPCPPSSRANRSRRKRYPASDGTPKLTSKRTPEWRPPARAESFIPGHRPTHPNVMGKRPSRETQRARRTQIGRSGGRVARRLDVPPPPSPSLASPLPCPSDPLCASA